MAGKQRKKILDKDMLGAYVHIMFSTAVIAAGLFRS
jgi:hypothetical protein